MSKLKTYVIIISEQFPVTHSRKGERTNFIQSIGSKIKIHTIRSNYRFWAKRFRKIEKGEGCLSIRVWIGKPYRSEQREIFNLTNIDGIGIQKLSFVGNHISIHNYFPELIHIANNDGLTGDDFNEWFKNVDRSKDMAIIHFTNFRYLT